MDIGYKGIGDSMCIGDAMGIDAHSHGGTCRLSPSVPENLSPLYTIDADIDPTIYTHDRSKYIPKQIYREVLSFLISNKTYQPYGIKRCSNPRREMLQMLLSHSRNEVVDILFACGIQVGTACYIVSPSFTGCVMVDDADIREYKLNQLI